MSTHHLSNHWFIRVLHMSVENIFSIITSVFPSTVNVLAFSSVSSGHHFKIAVVLLKSNHRAVLISLIFRPLLLTSLYMEVAGGRLPFVRFWTDPFATSDMKKESTFGGRTSVTSVKIDIISIHAISNEEKSYLYSLCASKILFLILSVIDGVEHILFVPSSKNRMAFEIY